MAAAMASSMSSSAKSQHRNSARIWTKSPPTDGWKPFSNASLSSKPAPFFFLCPIGLPPASAQKQISGWISRTMRRAFSLRPSSRSTSLIFRRIAKVCRVSPFPLASRLTRLASSYVAANSAVRTGTGNTLLARGALSLPRASVSHRRPSGPSGSPIGISTKMRSESSALETNSLIVLAMPQSGSPERARAK